MRYLAGQQECTLNGAHHNRAADIAKQLWKMVHVADSISVLSRRRRGRSPCGMGEVEKLFAHIDLSGVSLGQSGKLETCLDQFKDRGIVRYSVRHKVLLREG